MQRRTRLIIVGFVMASFVCLMLFLFLERGETPPGPCGKGGCSPPTDDANLANLAAEVARAPAPRTPASASPAPPPPARAPTFFMNSVLNASVEDEDEEVPIPVVPLSHENLPQRTPVMVNLGVKRLLPAPIQEIYDEDVAPEPTPEPAQEPTPEPAPEPAPEPPSPPTYPPKRRGRPPAKKKISRENASIILRDAEEKEEKEEKEEEE